MKKYVLILLVFVLTSCSTVIQEGGVTPTPNTTPPAVEKPTTTQSTKVEIDMNKLIVEEVNPMIEAYNKRKTGKSIGLPYKLELLDETINPQMIDDNDSYTYYEIKIDNLYSYAFYYGKNDNSIYNVSITANMNKAIENAKLAYPEEIDIARELEIYISNNEASLYGTGFFTSKDTVKVNGVVYSPIINFNNKKDIKSMEDLLWFYEQGYVWDKKEEIIKTIFNSSSQNMPAMIVDYNGYPYRYQCDCGLYPMSWIDINAEAILAVQNIDETTKKIEIVGSNNGEASALEFKAIVVATVKYEDNKWKVVSVENIWL